MSRRRNLNLPGHAHELTFSCYKKYPFLSKDRTCQWLGDALRQACDALSYELWAFVFMPDHVHTIVWPKERKYDIAAFRRAVKEPVARTAVRWLEEHSPAWLPKITRTRGRRTERLFWQPGGGYDRNITEVETLLRMIEYLHANPVRKQLCERPQDWTWSSAACLIAGGSTPIRLDRLREDFGDCGR